MPHDGEDPGFHGPEVPEMMGDMDHPEDSLHHMERAEHRMEADEHRMEGIEHRMKPGKHPWQREFRPPLMFGQHDLVSLIILILMMGMNVGVKLFFRQRGDRQKMEDLEKQNLEQQLEYLKYQINPHFFMNTLNNIHALVDIDSERAKQTIIELSHLMRYILYETNQPTVSLRRELTFVRHFLKLMKLRFDESVTLTYEEPDSAASGLEVGIPPLLLLTFIENAFKHGISHREPSFIDIKMTFEDKQLHFHCANSNFSSVSMRAQQGGVGLENVKKRLQLIYPNNHTLNIVPTDQVFTVDLWIPCLQYTPLAEGLHNPS